MTAHSTVQRSPSASSEAHPTTFRGLALAPALLEALRADNYERPTPIQAQSIPTLLSGRDLLGIAQTGTGKTAAFALPILHRLLAEGKGAVRMPVGRKPRVLVLAPTRELAAQIGESFAAYGRHTPLRHTVIFGGVGQGPQVRAIQQGTDILVATPGRLIDLLAQKLVSLESVSHFVLDEADRMLDMGFIDPIRRISAQVPRVRQTMLFSATMPKEIRHLADSLLTNPATVTVTPVSSAVDRIDQKLYFVLKAQKTQLLIHLFDELAMERAVVFTKTKHGADRLARKLKSAGIQSEAIHGNKAQNQRVRALDAFRTGRSPVLVATDVAARGLDIDDVTHVVNYDLPMEPEAYVHRIGRTARAGKSGHAISFCDTEERDLLRQVEKLIKFEIPRERVPESVPKSDPVTPTAAQGQHAQRPAPSGPRHHAHAADDRGADRGGSRGHSAPSAAKHEARTGGARGEHRGETRSEPRGEPRGQHRGEHRGEHRGGKPSKGNSPAPRGPHAERSRDGGRAHGGPKSGGHASPKSGGGNAAHGQRAAHPAQSAQRDGAGHAPQQRRLGGGFAKSPVRRGGGR